MVSSAEEESHAGSRFGLSCRTCNGYLAHPFTKLPALPTHMLSTDVFLLCNIPKDLFLELVWIPVLFLILWRKFLI